MQDVSIEQKLEDEKKAREGYEAEKNKANTITPEIFEADTRLNKKQMDVARVLHRAFKNYKMAGGDLNKNESLWNSKAVHELKKLGYTKVDLPAFLPIADYIRKLVINPLNPNETK